MKRVSLLLLPPGLRLNGDLVVRGDARIACVLRGSVAVRGRLEIDPRAVIDGRIASHSLQLETGATVRASLEIGKAARVEPALRRFLPKALFRAAAK